MDNEINSCLMLAVNLDTPVILGSVFDSKDYKDTGFELDSHITLMYAQGKEIPKDNILTDIKSSLKDSFENFTELCKEKEPNKPVLEYFDLGCFENDSDYLILKLRKDNILFNYLEMINKNLNKIYNVSSDFSNYTPHITLAELKPGTVNKYVTSSTIMNILEDSYFSFEDIILSYGTNNDVADRKQYYLTQFNCVDRFFRLKGLKSIVDFVG